MLNLISLEYLKGKPQNLANVYFDSIISTFMIDNLLIEIFVVKISHSFFSYENILC